MNKKYWNSLVDRYFEGETTEAEESELKAFLASGESEDPCFDEAKAVMGLFVAGRRRAAKVRRRRKAAVWMSAAAVTAIFVSVGVLMERQTCVMWENGVEITDRQEIIASAEDALFNIFSSGTDAEEELVNLFEIH